MKSFFEWFKSSTKVKRWIFLIIIGIVLTCYGFTKVLVKDKMEFSDLWSIIITFVIGFLAIIVGIVFIQKRNLEILVEANDTLPQNGKKANIKSLIFNKKVYEDGPKIVVLGGGTGVNSVIEGLKKYTSNITVILPMADNEEITNAKQNLELLPLNDIKASIVAMSDKQELMEKLLYWDFKNSALEGVNFGDLYMFAMNEIYDNPSEAVQKSTEVLNITGKVIPVTLDETTVCAELGNQTVVKGKSNIPEVVLEKVEKIQRVYLSPSNCKPAQGVIEAINEAEAIVIGPGDLYTNIIPLLLVKNVSKAIKESSAIKIYISNLMTQPGQTDNYTLSEHLKAIEAHVGTNLFNYCLTDTGEIVPEYIRKYNKEGADVVEVDNSKLSAKGPKIIQKSMSCIKDGKIRHNSDAIAINIVNLICNELIFQDKKHDSEYILLNAVLKEQKKQEKKRQKLIKKNGGRLPEKKSSPKRKSKFSSKYKDRVEYIQDSVTKKQSIAKVNNKNADTKSRRKGKTK